MKTEQHGQRPLGMPASRGGCDARRLTRLPGDAFLVNVGRGSALDQRALVALMREGRPLLHEVDRERGY